MDSKLYEKAINEAKIKVLEEELLRLTKENAELKSQLEPTPVIEPTREEKAKAALADHMLELVKAATEENIAALIAAKTDFHMFANEMTNRISELEKRVDAMDIFDKYCNQSCHSWLRSNKPFIIDLIMKNEFTLAGNTFEILVHDEEVSVTIKLYGNNISCSYLDIYQVVIGNKVIWTDQLKGVDSMPARQMFNKYSKFKEVCLNWAKYLKQYPNSTEPFEAELKKQGLI